MSFSSGLLSAAALLAAAGSVRAEGLRSDVPVEVVANARENGKRVFSIPVTVGTSRTRALLDTGSVPFLVLPGQLKAHDTSSRGGTFSVTYGGDRYYKGDVAQGLVRVGWEVAPVKLGRVTEAGCLPSAPNCPIAGEAVSQADFGGKYPAIIGARLDSGSALSNALVQLGARRYILQAPQLNQREDVGRLILNPSANETSRFRPLANLTVVDTATNTRFVDTVRGCLRDATRGLSLCGALFFDSGRTGITVYQQQDKPEVRHFAKGDRGQIEFTDEAGGELAGVDFPIGFNPVLTVSFAGTFGRYANAAGEPLPLILVGQAPYLGLDVLTDFDRRVFAVARRAPHADGLAGHVP